MGTSLTESKILEVSTVHVQVKQEKRGIRNRNRTVDYDWNKKSVSRCAVLKREHGLILYCILIQCTGIQYSTNGTYCPEKVFNLILLNSSLYKLCNSKESKT